MSDNHNSNANSNVSAYTKECLVNASVSCRALVEIYSNLEYWVNMEVKTVHAERERASQNRENLVVISVIAALDYGFWLFKAFGDENMQITHDESKAYALMDIYKRTSKFWDFAPNWSGMGALKRHMQGIEEDMKMLRKSCNTMSAVALNGPVQLSLIHI